MLKKLIFNNSLHIIIIIFFSFFINYHYGNIGVYPLDTFAFLDTSYNILIGNEPFRDFWVTTGPFVDYLQAIFFKLFGIKWLSFVIHASFVNTVVSISFYLLLRHLNLDRFESLFYTMMFSLLCYTISGTPFAYLHSYTLSLISIIFLIYFLNTNSNVVLFFLPILMLLSFISMQNPSTFINLIILFFLAFYFFENKNKNFLYFITGSVFSISMLIFFVVWRDLPVTSIINQYFLFPISMGENRLTGNELSHISLLDNLTIRGFLGHFKFLHLTLLSIICVATFLYLKKTIKKNEFYIYLLIGISGYLLILNQLITSNQTYIFSYIPFAAAFLHILYLKIISKKKLLIFFLPIVLVISAKYHFEYNQKRKFHDLQNVNLKEYVPASKIDKKFQGLKWISTNFPLNPDEEIKLIKDIASIIKNDKKNKMIITEYQFFTFLLEENLNILNRWYTHDNNSYPLKNHKLFETYKIFFNKKLNDKKIEIVYTIGHPNFEDFLIYNENLCFDKKIVNKISSAYQLKKCN